MREICVVQSCIYVHDTAVATGVLLPSGERNKYLPLIRWTPKTGRVVPAPSRSPLMHSRNHVGYSWTSSPSRSATSATGWPRSTTWRTASSLNSGVYLGLLICDPLCSKNSVEVSAEAGQVHLIRACCYGELELSLVSQIQYLCSPSAVNDQRSESAP